MLCSHLASIEARLQLPGASKSVYLDECTRCFRRVEDDDGIYICLSCFNTSCRDDAGSHARGAGDAHAAALHLRKTPLRDANGTNKIDEEPPSKVTKLAIGVEGGFSLAPDVVYESQSEICCVLCATDVVVDTDSSPVIAAFVEELLRRPSASSQAQIDSWEEERVVCSHTKNLEQMPNAPKLDSAQLAHCMNCELQENLWLCLTCGSLACGRQIHGGGGGNGHGLLHYTHTQHPVVCKLGTITPEGAADIYCYVCDDMKLDDALAHHLQHFGIDVAQQSKTAQSMAELELAQNLNHEWSQVIEKGQVMKLLWGPGRTGLSNLGNSCYMASVLQVLFSFKSFQERYYCPSLQQHRRSCRSNEPWNCYSCQMAKLADGLLSGDFSQRPAGTLEMETQLDSNSAKETVKQPGIAPRMFKTFITREHAEFRSSRQQDAFEFFQFLTHRVRQEEHRFSCNPASIFEHAMEDRLECLSCNRVRYRSVNTSDFALLIPEDFSHGKSSTNDAGAVEWPEVSLQRCLEASQEPSIIDYRCPHCKTETQARTTTRFETAPDVLVMHVRRFVCPNYVPEKLGTRIIVPDGVVDLERMRARGQQDDELALPDDVQQQQQQQQQQQEFVPNELFLVQLESMGFGHNRCVRALQAVDNAGAEAAMTWLFEHGDDANIDEPLVAPAGSGVGGGDDAAVANLCAMGFEAARCRHALAQVDGDLERAVDWLFSHANEELPTSNDDGGDETTSAKPGSSEASLSYRLVASITHLGRSLGFGHYVCHVYDDVSKQWIYYNDSKVSTSSQPPLDLAYIYFFKRID